MKYLESIVSRLLFAAACLFGCSLSAEDFGWKLGGVTESTLTGLPISDQWKEPTYPIYLRNEREKGDDYGPFYFWKPHSGGGFVQITNSISGLGLAIKTGTSGKLSIAEKRQVVSHLVGEFSRRDQTYVFSGEFRTSYLTQLAKVSEETAEKLGAITTDLVETWDKGAWSFTFYSITARGSVERLKITGTDNPIRVRKVETELVWEDGAIPRFDYQPEPISLVKPVAPVPVKK